MSAATDVVVVGGGPAGAAAAALLAADGLRVVVLERAAFPRDKVCGEFVASLGRAVLERLGVLDDVVAAGASRLDCCRLSTPRRALDTPLAEAAGGGAALGVSRARLDELLLRRAAARGAEVRERCQVRAPRFGGSRVTGVSFRTRGSTRDQRLDAPLVIAADGRRSVLGAALHPQVGDPRRTHLGSRFGLATHLAGHAARLGRRVELHLFDGGYAGLAPVEDGRINLSLVVTVRALRACGNSPERLLAERLRANPSFAASTAGARPAGRWHSVGPLRFAVRRPAAAGVLFAGDAAGTIDPFCGEGISHALAAAELLRPIAHEAVARGGADVELERAWEYRWRARFVRPTERARWLGRAFERPRLASALLLLLGGPARGLLPRLVAATRHG